MQGTPLQHQVLGSLIQDFNGGNPDLTQQQQCVRACERVWPALVRRTRSVRFG